MSGDTDFLPFEIGRYNYEIDYHCEPVKGDSNDLLKDDCEHGKDADAASCRG